MEFGVFELFHDFVLQVDPSGFNFFGIDELRKKDIFQFSLACIPTVYSPLQQSSLLL